MSTIRLPGPLGIEKSGLWVWKKPFMPVIRVPGPLGLQSNSHPGKPLTAAQQGHVTFAENYRKLALGVATGILLDFAERVTRADPSISGKDPTKLYQLDKKDAHTLKGFRIYFNLYPNSFDWMNDPSAKLMLDTVQTLITLFIQNAERMECHLLFPQPPDAPNVAAKATRPMEIYPAFFTEWSDPLGPVLAIVHEYFHYLFLPGTRQPIFHGSSSPQRSDTESALENAYELSGLAMWLAFGRTVNGK
jgi:hypothetical protein